MIRTSICKPMTSIVALCIVLYSSITSITAQSNVYANLGLVKNYYRGGFEYSEYTPHATSRMAIGYDRYQNHLLGISFAFATGVKTPTFKYPQYRLCQDAQGPVICVDASAFPQGTDFHYYETFIGGTLFIKRILRVRMGPYMTINGKSSRIPSMGIDPNIYHPSATGDVYKRFEFGSQAQLSLMLPIGKHFNLQADGLIGASFHDLRKDQWKDAKTLVMFTDGVYVPMQSEKVTNRFFAVGLGVGYSW